MKIINIGILAHVDAGKTTLTESLLYASGAISEPGSVEKGTTRTDTMFLERQRGITIQAAVTSFQWHRCKVNIVDTPGHMDFLAEVYRSLAVLDGAILVISAKDGVQAQTRILFHALRKMNIPTVIFINKIDQAGVDLQSVVQSVRDKLSADIIIKQTVSLSPEIVLEENTDIEAWDAVIENNDELLEKYIAGEPISREKLVREEQRRVQDASLFPVYYDALAAKTTAAVDRAHALAGELQTTEAALSKVSGLMGAVVDYARARPVFDGYKAARYSKKYLAEHETELADYRAAKAAMNELLGGAKLPKMDVLKKRRRELAEKRKALYAEYRTAQQDMRELTAAKGNLDHLYRATEGRGHKAQER